MYYTIYKTTNLKDGKIYIGAHKTDDINDSYLGSGKYLKRAIKKFGIDSFEKEILYIFSNKEDMYKKESELVTEDFISTNNTYNIKLGGSGGNPGIIGAFSGRKHTKESKDKIRQAALKQKTTDGKRKKLKENSWARRDPEAQREHARKIASRSRKERPRFEETSKKLKEANLGKILVNNGLVAKRISKEDINKYVVEGWERGGMPRKKRSPLR